MPRFKHIHTVRKVNIASKVPVKGVKPKPYFVWQCKAIDCTYQVPFEMLRGKMVICNRCGDPMLMTPIAMQLTDPHCEACIKRKDAEKIDIIGDFLKDKGV
jgi:formylmethanofuran dehydrogenase subunit E